MMRKIITAVLAFIALASGTVSAADEITVKLNGEKLDFDTAPQVINDRTMVPMRNIFTSLGAEVEWVEEDKLIYAVKDSATVVMCIGSELMYVTDRKVMLDVPPMLTEGRTLVPLRAISECFGMQVDWDGDTRTVSINEK